MLKFSRRRFDDLHHLKDEQLTQFLEEAFDRALGPLPEDSEKKRLDAKAQEAVKQHTFFNKLRKLTRYLWEQPRANYLAQHIVVFEDYICAHHMTHSGVDPSGRAIPGMKEALDRALARFKALLQDDSAGLTENDAKARASGQSEFEFYKDQLEEIRMDLATDCNKALSSHATQMKTLGKLTSSPAAAGAAAADPNATRSGKPAATEGQVKNMLELQQSLQAKVKKLEQDGPRKQPKPTQVPGPRVPPGGPAVPPRLDANGNPIV